MKLILTDKKVKNCVAIIGNFDGVHCGHLAIIDGAKKIANNITRAKNLKKKLSVVAITFSPHPNRFFAPKKPFFELTNIISKDELLKKSGVDKTGVLNFTKEFASLSADEFIKNYLLKQLQVSHVVVGFNFYFGKGRSGSPQFLVEKGKEYGFGVSIVGEQKNETGEVISSSQIRQYLKAGEITKANKMLGYRFLVGGTIAGGEKRGRELGYPTANIRINAPIPHGIYAVRLRELASEKLYNGVASFGRRPTFDNGAEIFETYIFNFNEDIYGKNVCINLFEYLRGEEKFENIADLKKQMQIDCQRAKDILAQAKPLSRRDKSLSFSGLVK